MTRNSTKLAVTIAFIGDGWQLPGANAHGAVVHATSICQRHICHLPPHPTAAAAVAANTIAWIDERLDEGLAVAGYVGYEIGSALEHVDSGAAAGVAQFGARQAHHDAPRVPDAVLWAMKPDSFVPLQSDPIVDSDLPKTDRAPRAPIEPPADLARQRASYLRAVSAALQAIAVGRYYQLNMSVRFSTAMPPALIEAPLAAVLARLRQPQPVPLAMAMQLDGHRIFGLSMEQFVRVRPMGDGRRVVRSRPIKGTIAREVDPSADRLQAQRLRQNTKEQAENTMIVDMMRNDLARVAVIGSITVPHLLETVPYRTLWHLESEVEAILPPATTQAELLTATLPPASVTGCPKIAAMGAIAQLEDRRRGPYCGVQGIWRPDGSVDLAVGIRSIIQHGSTACLDVGAGIVADSQPEQEWRETCLKASAALRGLGQ